MTVKSTLIEQDNKLVVCRSFDAEPYLDDAKARHNSEMFGSSEMKHAGTYPPGFFEWYATMRGVSFDQLMTDDQLLREMLNDPHLDGFRIWKGRV